MFWESNPTNIEPPVFLGNTGLTIEKSSATLLFQGLMESDGLKDVEQDRLEDLMRYIRQSLEKAT